MHLGRETPSEFPLADLALAHHLQNVVTKQTVRSQLLANSTKD